MTTRSDTLLGKMAAAARTGPPVLRVTVPPRVARFLIAAGGRAASGDGMSVRFPGPRHDLGGGEEVARAIFRLRDAIRRFRNDVKQGPAHAESLRRSVLFLDSAATNAERAVSPGPTPSSDLSAATRVAPRTIWDARHVGDLFRAGQPVIMDLAGMRPTEVRRIVDFAAGLIFGLDGAIDRLESRVFILTPDTGQPREYVPRVNPELFFAIDNVHEVVGEIIKALDTSGGRTGAESFSKAVAVIDWLAADDLPVDVSGMDLTSFNLNSEDLAGAVWSEDTKWPDLKLAARIRSESEEIQPGVYRVLSSHDAEARRR
jgi:hypothetical protein